MPKFDAIVYVSVRIRVTEVEAKSSEEAAEKAFNQFDYHDLVRKGEYAEEILEVKIDPLDEKGEIVYEGSQDFKMSNGKIVNCTE